MYQISVSDLHLGEGVLYEDGNLNPLEDFHHDKDFCKWLKTQHDRYKRSPICLNLLGDTFDPSQVRFQGKLVDPPYEHVAVYKMKAIINGHPLFFEVLKFWVSKNRPVHIFIGNHDAMLAWPKVQLLLKEIIAPQNPELVKFYFEKTHAGTYFSHGNWDLFSRLNRDQLFTESPDRRTQILNMPDDSIFHIGVVNPLKLWNKYVARMAQHRHSAIFKDALFRNWWFVWLAATCWLKVLFGTIFDFLRDYRWSKWDRLRRSFKLLGSTVFQTFWNAVFGDNIEKYAKKILRSKNLNAVVLGHTHGCLQKTIGHGWYVNTGTWSMRFVVKPKRGLKRLWIFAKPIIERQDKLTYVITKHKNNKTVSVQLEEFIP